MNIDKIRDLVNYESPTSRVAELAALFISRSVKVEAVEAIDTEQSAYGVVTPNASFPLSYPLAASHRRSIGADWRNLAGARGN